METGKKIHILRVLTLMNLFLFGLLDYTFSQCPPELEMDNEVTITCGDSFQLAEESDQEEPDFELASTCEKTQMSQNGPLTQGGGIYNNGVVTTGGTTNINNTNTLVDVTHTDPMGPNAWQTLWYSNFTDQYVEVCPSDVFHITINAKSLYSNSPYFCQIWVDWNNDGQFTEDEVVHNSGPYNSNNFTVEGDITVPANQQDGAFRMRIRFKDNAPFVPTDSADGCTFGNSVGIPPGYGGYTGNNYGYYYFSDEVEDYTVMVNCNDNSGGGDYTYQWTPSDGLDADDIPTPIATPDETTTYTVTITDTETGCETVQEITVIVEGDELPEFDIPETVCEGQEYVLPEVSNNGITGTWNPPTFNDTQTTEYTFMPNEDQACATEATVEIEIIQGASATIEGDATLCLNEDEPQITFTGLNGTSPYTFTYTINGGTEQTIESIDDQAVINVPTDIEGTFTYTLTGVSDANATSCESEIDQSVVIEIVEGDIPPVFDIPETVCEGQDYILPEVSEDGIIGSWEPSTFDATQTTEYTFVPDEGQACATETSIEIEIIQGATANIEGNASICLNEDEPTVTFTGMNGTAPYTFTYTINNGTEQTIVSEGDHAVINVPTNEAGTYTYTLVEVSDANASSCDSDVNQSVVIEIHEGPTAIISGDATVCQNDESPEITFTGIGGTAPYTFIYTINGGSNNTIDSENDNSATITVPTEDTGTFVYELISVSDNSATVCSNDISESITVDINEGITGNVLPSIDACLNDTNTPQIVFEAIGGNAPIDFIYTINGGTEQIVTATTGNTASITIPTSTSGVFQVELVEIITTNDDMQCSSIQNSVVVVEIHDLPTVNAGQDIAVCSGSSVTLTATGATTYIWDNGVSNGVAFTPSESQTYTVTGTDVNGCSNSDNVIVTLTEAEPVHFTVDRPRGCAPLTVHFTGSLSNGNCVYKLSNGVVLNDCNPTYTFEHPGCYDVELVVTFGDCVSTYTAQNVVCVDAAPDASFNFNPDQVTSIENTVDFINTTTGGTSYQWNFGDGTTSNLDNPSHEYSINENSQFENGFIVTLVAQSAFGCADTAVAVIPVGDDLIYYVPNAFTPDKDNYNEIFKPVFTSGFDPQNYHLTIFNRWGEIVFESYNADFGWDGTYGGKIVKEGVYVWKIDFKRKGIDKHISIHGHLNLLK